MAPDAIPSPPGRSRGPRADLAQRGAVALILLLALSACGPPTLNTKNRKRIVRSLEKIEEGLEPTRVERFQQALEYLVGGASFEEAGDDEDRVKLVLDIYGPLHGMTAEAIIAEAKRRRVVALETIISEIEEPRESSEEGRKRLSGFKIVESRVYKKNVGFLEWPVVELTVENRTGREVFVAHFRAVLLEPGNPEPWADEQLQQIIHTGMVPGERATWRIEPESQRWKVTDPHPQYDLMITVRRLDGVGRRLIAETAFDAIDEARLDVLHERLAAVLAEE